MFFPDAICIQDVCDRLDGSIERATAMLAGDIGEAKSWLLKYEDALCEIATLRKKNGRLIDEVAALKNKLNAHNRD
jgi:hypothetical protein